MKKIGLGNYLRLATPNSDGKDKNIKVRKVVEIDSSHGNFQKRQEN